MKVALQELPNFEEEIEDDPLKLLESIVLLMHTPMRALYPHMGLIEAIARLVNMCQYENEDMISYVERFKQERQIVKSLMRRGCLDHFIKNTSEYKEEKEINKKKRCWKMRSKSSYQQFFLGGHIPRSTEQCLNDRDPTMAKFVTNIQSHSKH